MYLYVRKLVGGNLNYTFRLVEHVQGKKQTKCDWFKQLMLW